MKYVAGIGGLGEEQSTKSGPEASEFGGGGASQGPGLQRSPTRLRPRQSDVPLRSPTQAAKKKWTPLRLHVQHAYACI